ncbi:hypothetical protein FAZ15_02710 [Sphingobacterium olei]|uniref:DUF5000 domain-containing protein n=1 Tax=Sphingobacterium olei TaxID=2571155 RepID=A0A4U0P775_9SPHI|nr:DUF4998 domain-containing protein [Sphingobacterium olei]TJZ63219.1 hypothetical protein FAZ15_02710 [Sphingobacterium olei]
MRQKVIFNIIGLLMMGSIFLGCEKYADDYKDYLDNKEVVYPGLVRNVRYQAGNLRAVLIWNPSPDPNIKNYVVRWNNGTGTATVEATTHDPAEEITVVIPGLNEYVYSFSITAYDEEGNASVGQDINNVRVYGPSYESTLLNRGYNTSDPYQFLADGTLQLNFNRRDTMNVSTTISYTNTLGEQATAELDADVNTILIPGYQLGTAIKYRSSYQPEPDSYDVFHVMEFADFPTIIKITELDKSLFRAMLLPGDNDQEYSWVLSNLWNNRYYKSTSDNPDEGFHTGGTGMPQSFTFDLGRTAKLDHFRLWQRDNALYAVANFKVFEVWGSDTAPNMDGSWTEWTKLETFTSVKPSGLPSGQVSDGDRTYARAGEKFMMPASVPEIRYLRFKVLETWGSAGYLHATELTFFEAN